MPREKKPFTRLKIRLISQRFFELGQDIAGFAAVLDESKFDEPLLVDAGDAMNTGLIHASKWLNKLQDAYRIAKHAHAAETAAPATPAPDFTDVATGDASPGATEATEKEAVKPHKGLSTGEVAPDSGVRPPQGKRAKVKPKGK